MRVPSTTHQIGGMRSKMVDAQETDDTNELDRLGAALNFWEGTVFEPVLRWELEVSNGVSTS